MKKAWAWLKRWGGILLGVLVAVLTLGFVVRGQKSRKRLGKVKDELAVERAITKTHSLRAVREHISVERGEVDDVVVDIDKQLETQRQAIIDGHEGGEDLTDDEMEEELKRLLS